MEADEEEPGEEAAKRFLEAIWRLAGEVWQVATASALPVTQWREEKMRLKKQGKAPSRIHPLCHTSGSP